MNYLLNQFTNFFFYRIKLLINQLKNKVSRVKLEHYYERKHFALEEEEPGTTKTK